MTKEGKVKNLVKKILEKYKVYFFMPATHGYGRSGVPDLICCFKGRFVGVECKAGKGKTTALQDREMRLIRESGGTTFVVNEENLQELEDWFERQV